MLKRHFDTIFGAMSVVVVVVVAVIVAVSCVKPKTQPTLPPNHPKRPTSPQATIYTQQSAPVCLYRHQRDTIIASPPPPWRRCAVVGRCCHCPGPKTRTWHKRRRGSWGGWLGQQTRCFSCRRRHRHFRCFCVQKLRSSMSFRSRDLSQSPNFGIPSAKQIRNVPQHHIYRDGCFLM